MRDKEVTSAFFTEVGISEDENYWVNQAVAAYFDKDSITMIIDDTLIN